VINKIGILHLCTFKMPIKVYKNKLENVRKNTVDFFCLPTYGAKNYDEYMKEYGMCYRLKH